MEIKIVENQVTVKEFGTLPDGVEYLTIGLYSDYLEMPVALEFKGVRYGRSGWNSDTHEVYYRSDVKTATMIKRGDIRE